MKVNSTEKKFLYAAFHQVFTVALVICIYAYEYALDVNKEQDEIVYLMLAFMGLLGSIASLAGFTINEGHIEISEKKGIDKIYIELVILIGFGILFLLIKLLIGIEVSDYTLPGLMITVAIFAYFTDIVLFACYCTIIHRIINKRLIADSFLYKCWQMLCNYEKGVGLYELSQKSQEQAKIKEALEKIAKGQLEIKLEESQFHGQEKQMAIAINQIQEGLRDTIEARTKDEKMKVDLITNVSHDIKTPLTSIVNYVELLKMEELNNPSAEKYIRIISDKAQRLKTLTEDLVEISKISSGNIKLEKQKIDFLELLYQTGGEFNEKFEERSLTIITKLPTNPVYIEADGRQLYRAIENLYTNAAKYALQNTKVYVELMTEDKTVIFRMKNIIKEDLKFSEENYDDLMERFVRGESSRTTEGSGLGLSITKSLITLMGGDFLIRIERDHFMAQITFPVANSR